MKILILNGPNLNLLGQREPHIYGSDTFEAYFEKLKATFPDQTLTYAQSNHEGQLVDHIHQAEKDQDGLVINGAAYTHTSVALADALKAVSLPTVEVHISNIFQREEFRHHSFLSPVVDGMITGLGLKGYALAIRYLLDR